MTTARLCLAVAAMLLACSAISVHGGLCSSKYTSLPLTGPQDPFGTAGDFDYYLLAQSWSPGFCATKVDAKLPGCLQPTDFQRVNLTIHGLWPQYNQSRSGHQWPQFCQSTSGSDLDPIIVNALLPSLQQYWPSQQAPAPTPRELPKSLWAHEWGKHGTCSGLDQKGYLQQAMTIHVGTPTPSIISSNVGNAVPLAKVAAAYGAQECTAGGNCMVGFGCSWSKDCKRQFLAEVITCWDRDINQIGCPGSVLKRNQCTDKVDITLTAFP